MKRFVFEGNDLTVIEMDGKPYWIAREVGRALKYENDGKGLIDTFVRNWISEFDEGDDFVKLTGQKLADFKQLLELGDKSSLSSDLNFKHVPSILLFTKDGVFGVLQLTKKEEGRRMRKWLRREVLPSIEETGGYSMNDGISVDATRKQLAQTLVKTAQMLIDSETEREEAEARLLETENQLGEAYDLVDAMEPYAAYGQAVCRRKGARHVGTFCKSIWVNGKRLKQNFVFNKLIEYKWLFQNKKRKESTAYAVDQKYMICKTSYYIDLNGEKCSSTTPMITPYGEQRFLAKLRKEPEYRGLIIYVEDDDEGNDLPVQYELDFGGSEDSTFN